jgi:hypothetical protein
MLEVKQDSTHEISQPPQDSNNGPRIFRSTMRSFSVPANLPKIAHEFMDRVQVNSQINGDLAMPIYPSKHRYQSGDIHPNKPEDETEDDNSANFFLPFDDDVAEPVEETRISPSQPLECRQNILNARLLEPNVMEEKPQQQPREAAMVCLEEFFFGGSPTHSHAVETETQTSPASVLDLRNIQVRNEMSACCKTKQPATSDLPKRNIFGHVIQEESPAVTPLTSQPTQVDPLTAQHEFAMLDCYDRASSLPLNLMEMHPISRKSSLKKFSSICNVSKTGSFPSLKPTVSFSNLEIREYDVALSDHPSCSFGPPVQLSWEYKQKEVVPVESYEQSRSPRRKRHNLVLSYYDRLFLLIKQAGYTKNEIKQTMLEVERVKRERIVTDLFLPASGLDETMETVLYTVKKLFAPKQGEDDMCSSSLRRTASFA